MLHQPINCRLIAPVAQLDRASVYGTEGYRFESYRVYSEGQVAQGVRKPPFLHATVVAYLGEQPA